MKHLFKRVGCLLLALCLVCAVIPLGPAVHAEEAEPVSEYYHATGLSQGVQNIVKRAEQMMGIQWTPQKNITGWKGNVTYKAGVTYTGLPYGRPTDGDYVPWETSLDGFLKAVNDPGSKMYTSYSTNQGRAPYYSLDCSAFVSWAWGLSSRQYTWGIPDYATKISETSYAKMEVGDCLSRSGWHVVLVTDIVYNSAGTIVAVELAESDGGAPNALCHSFWYGQGYSLSMSDFQKTYLDDGYILYRCKTRDSVTYTHSCASPLPGDDCSCMHTHSYSAMVTAPTCTAGGCTVHTCSCGDSYTDSYTNALGHSFTQYVSNGNATCTADGTKTATCDRCDVTDTLPDPGSAAGHDYGAAVTAPTCTEQGYTTYTCGSCGHSYVSDYVDAGHRYEDGICTGCGAEEPPKYMVTYTSASISLEGDIGLNYYAQLSEDLAAAEGAYMQFTVAGQTQTIPVSDAKTADGSHVFTCRLAAKQMTDEVTGQIYLSDGTAVGEAKVYSVKAYCDTAIPYYSQFVAHGDLVELMEAMLNYGAYSQLQFDYNTDNLANVGMDPTLPDLTEADVAAYAHGSAGSESGISVSSVSLLLESTTTIRFYFQLDGTRPIDSYTFLVDGMETMPVQAEENLYYVDKTNVAAKNLDEMATVTVGGLTARYCGLSYVRQVAVLSPGSYSEDLVNAVRALYAYNQAANTYFA